MTSNGNAKYTHIQSHGAPSAYEPGFIEKAATIGLFRTIETASPSLVLDVTIDISGAIATSLFVIGEAIAPGCVLVNASLDSNNTVPAGTVFTVGTSEPPIAPATVTAFAPATANGFTAFAPTAVPGVLGDDPNGSQLVISRATVAAPGATGSPVFPAIQLTTVPTPLEPLSLVRVKLVYFCP
jgi:hypothetical protein